MWQGDHNLLLQCYCIITQVILSNRSHRELNSKRTRQQLPSWPWFVCSVNHTCIYTPNIICLWPFLSNYALYLGLGLSNQPLKSLKRSCTGQEGKSLSSMQDRLHQHMSLSCPPQRATPGRASSCRERLSPIPAVQVPSTELLRERSEFSFKLLTYL